MKIKICLLLFLFSSFAYASPATLCVKNNLVIKDGRGKISKVFKAIDGQCPKGSVAIFNSDSVQDILNKTKSADGAGSELDADSLDGHSSEYFASAAELSNLQNSMAISNSALEATTANHTSAISALNTDTTSLGSRTTTAESSIAAQGTRLDAVESETRIQNIVRVGLTGGDTNSLSAAISAINSASPAPSTSNPYLIIIGPGTYSVNSTLTIPAGVRLKGSGITQTIISGAINSGSGITAAVLRLSKGSEISDLTVQNTSTASSLWSIGVIAFLTTAETSFQNLPKFDTVIERVKIKVTGSGAAAHTGINVNDSDIVIRDSLVQVENSSTSNVGIEGLTGSNSMLYVINTSVYAGTSAGSSEALYMAELTPAGGYTQTVKVQNSILHSEKTAVKSDGASLYINNSLITSNSVSGAALSALNSGSIVINNSTLDAFDNATTASGGVITCSFISELNGGGYSNLCE